MANGDDYQTLWLPRGVMRARAEVPSVTRQGLDAVEGFLKPRYVEHMEDGRRVAELSSADLRRVQDGYACGECLAFFGRRFGRCPACNHELDPNRDIVDYSPDHWQPSEGRTSEEIFKSQF